MPDALDEDEEGEAPVENRANDSGSDSDNSLPLNSARSGEQTKEANHPGLSRAEIRDLYMDDEDSADSHVVASIAVGKEPPEPEQVAAVIKIEGVFTHSPARQMAMNGPTTSMLLTVAEALLAEENAGKVSGGNTTTDLNATGMSKTGKDHNKNAYVLI